MVVLLQTTTKFNFNPEYNLYSKLVVTCSGVVRNFREGVNNCVIVSKQCTDFLTLLLTTDMLAGLTYKSLRNHVPKYYEFS